MSRTIQLWYLQCMVGERFAFRDSRFLERHDNMQLYLAVDFQDRREC